MPIDRILVPIDFSECSPTLVAESIRLALQLDASLTLLHVIEPPEGLSPETPVKPGRAAEVTTLSSFLTTAAESRMAELRRHCVDAGLHTETRLRVARITDCIVAETRDFDLVLMGTHGRQGGARLVLGSVAEQVMRRTDTPVMTIRTRHRPTCEASGCDWCATHVKWEALLAVAETVG